mgnify:CR=1 FL=1
MAKFCLQCCLFLNISFYTDCSCQWASRGRVITRFSLCSSLVEWQPRRPGKSWRLLVVEVHRYVPCFCFRLWEILNDLCTDRCELNCMKYCHHEGFEFLQVIVGSTSLVQPQDMLDRILVQDNLHPRDTLWSVVNSLHENVYYCYMIICYIHYFKPYFLWSIEK